jgi:ArsR family transcriptional regulator
VLRRAGVVEARKQGTSVIYSIASPEIVEMLAVARRALSGLLSGQVGLLRDLEAGA